MREVLADLLALVMLTACQLETPVAASTKATGQPAAPADMSHAVVERRCGVATDTTVSGNPEFRKWIMTRLSSSIGQIIDDEGCTTVTISAFSDRGIFESVQYFPIPAEVNQPCAAAALTPAERTLASFPGRKLLTQDACAKQRNAEDERNSAARLTVIEKISAALLEIAPGNAQCTDWLGEITLLNKISRPNDIDWLISDFAQTCPNTVVEKANHEIRFVLLPLAEDDHQAVAQQAIANAKHLAQTFPGSRYLLPAQMNADKWWKGVHQ